MPNSHDPSLRVPLSRLPQSACPQPPADAGGVLPSAAIAREALRPFHFVLNQIWIGVAPLADLLGLPMPIARTYETPRAHMQAGETH